jgi:hypothetical protein
MPFATMTAAGQRALIALCPLALLTAGWCERAPSWSADGWRHSTDGQENA